MPTYPSRLTFNACSYVNPTWTFLSPNWVTALYSQHSILEHDDTKSQSWICRGLSLPLPWAPKQGLGLTVSPVPSAHTHTVLCLGLLASRSSWECFSSSCPLSGAFSHHPSGTGLHSASCRKLLLTTLAWLALIHEPVSGTTSSPSLHLPHSAVVTYLTVYQASLLLSFPEAKGPGMPPSPCTAQHLA